jgi:hypothetical protein
MSKNQKENQENDYILNSHLNNLYGFENEEVYETHRSFFQNLENNYKKDIKPSNNNTSKNNGGGRD